MSEINDNNLDIINYRLSSIEKELKELKELLITVPLLIGRIENIEKRLDAAETNVDLLHKEVSKLKAEPDKKAAGRFNYIADYIFKTIVGIVVAWLIMRTGLGGN